MASVVVVGGGFAGLSAASRLAKLSHDVCVLEASDMLGGLLLGVPAGRHRWPLHAEPMTLPGVVRDLFRKSGRPLERVLDLSPAPPRRHLLADGSSLDLPMGNRSSQHDAVMAMAGGDRWSPWLDQWSGLWNSWRRGVLDQVPTTAAALGRPALRDLRPRRSAARAAGPLKDSHLKAVALGRLALEGHDPRTTPAVAIVDHYVERNFGLWQVDGGRPALAEALVRRLAERQVDVRLATRAHDVALGTTMTVLTDTGDVTADLVIWCAPRPPACVPSTALPLVPAARTFVTLGAGAPQLADDTLVDDTPPIRVFRAGPDRWTIEHRAGEDCLMALARHGVDLRPYVTERHDLSPGEVAALGHPGWAWTGFGSFFRRPGVNPRSRLFLAGYAGMTLEAIGMSTAAIAAHIGKA